MNPNFLKYIFTFIVISFSYILHAQDLPIEEEVKPIAVENIPDFNRNVNVKILDIKNKISEDKSIEIENHKIDSLSKKIHYSSKLTDSLDIDNLTLNKIEKIERNWQSLFNELSAINNPLDDKIKAYGDYYTDIDKEYQVALETSIAIKNQTISSELKISIKETKLALREFRAQIKEQQGNYLKLKSECTALVNITTIQVNNLRNARSNIVRNLLISEQDPLWKSIRIYKKDTLVLAEESNIIYAEKNAMLYWEKNRSVPLILVLIFLLFLTITHLLKKSLRDTDFMDEINSNKATKTIINKPILISIIFTWFIFVIAFYIPIEISAIWLTLMLIPLLIVIKDIFRAQSISTILMFSFYYLFRAFEFIYDETTITARIFTIILDIVSIIILLLIIKRINNIGFVDKVKWIVKIIFFVLISLLFSSLFFNLLGNVRLSNILTVGSIDVVITGVLLLCIFHIFFALVKLLVISPMAQKLNVIKNHREALLKNIRKILVFFAIFYWITLSLNHFGILEEVVTSLKSYYFKEFHFGNTTFAINNFIAFILAIYLSIVISKVLRLILEEDVFTRSKTDKGTSSTIILLFRYSVITIGFLIAMSAAGIKMEKISIIIGALGVGIGFGLQDVFNNLVSGIILAIERPIAVDDIIEVGSLTGIVKEIGFRSSRVRTYDGSEVVVPNGHIVSNQMINWTLSDRKRRLKIDFGVSYDSDPNEVIEVMKEITHENPSIVQDPAPRPRFVEFGDSSLNFQLLFWISDYENSFGIGTETMLSLYSKLKERGIEIPFPQRDIRIVDITKDKKGTKLTE